MTTLSEVNPTATADCRTKNMRPSLKILLADWARNECQVGSNHGCSRNKSHPLVRIAIIDPNVEAKTSTARFGCVAMTNTSASRERIFPPAPMTCDQYACCNPACARVTTPSGMLAPNQKQRPQN